MLKKLINIIFIIIIIYNLLHDTISYVAIMSKNASLFGKFYY